MAFMKKLLAIQIVVFVVVALSTGAPTPDDDSEEIDEDYTNEDDEDVSNVYTLVENDEPDDADKCADPDPYVLCNTTGMLISVYHKIFPGSFYVGESNEHVQGCNAEYSAKANKTIFVPFGTCGLKNYNKDKSTIKVSVFINKHRKVQDHSFIQGSFNHTLSCSMPSLRGKVEAKYSVSPGTSSGRIIAATVPKPRYTLTINEEAPRKGGPRAGDPMIAKLNHTNGLRGIPKNCNMTWGNNPDDVLMIIDEKGCAIAPEIFGNFIWNGEYLQLARFKALKKGNVHDIKAVCEIDPCKDDICPQPDCPDDKLLPCLNEPEESPVK